MSALRTNNKKRRSQKACNFCHQRKLKCNNATPRCTNCLAYEQECTYDQTPKRLRPSNDRIERLQEQNRRLHAQLASQTADQDQGLYAPARVRMGRSANPSIADALDSPMNMDSTRALPQPDRSRSPVRHTVPDLEFHGLSSLLFDETTLEQDNGQKAIASVASESVDSTRLMAEAAAQREPPIPIILPDRLCLVAPPVDWL